MSNTDMNLAAEIRDLLQSAGVPLSVETLCEKLGYTADKITEPNKLRERRQRVSQAISTMRRREAVVNVQYGKHATYILGREMVYSKGSRITPEQKWERCVARHGGSKAAAYRAMVKNGRKNQLPQSVIDQFAPKPKPPAPPKPKVIPVKVGRIPKAPSVVPPPTRTSASREQEQLDRRRQVPSFDFRNKALLGQPDIDRDTLQQDIDRWLNAGNKVEVLPTTGPGAVSGNASKFY